MPNTAKCPICANDAEIGGAPAADKLTWTCPRCGKFDVTGSAEDGLRSAARDQPGAISGWIRQQNSQGLTPFIGTTDLQRLRAMALPPLKERSELYHQAAVRSCPRLDDEFVPTSEELIGASYSADRAEASIIAKYLVNKGLLLQRPGGNWRVSPEGRIAADELAARRAASTQAFIAMWFSEEMMRFYREAIEPAVRSAGYTPMMIGDKDTPTRLTMRSSPRSGDPLSWSPISQASVGAFISKLALRWGLAYG